MTASTETNAPDSAYPLSYYAASRHVAPERAPLQGRETTQVCVIGAGFSGLATALSLAEDGYRVVVLESAHVGFGASGRNGGQMVNSFNRDLDAIERRFGKDRAAQLGKMAFEGGEIIRTRISRYGIQCDLRDGGVFAAFNNHQLRELKERVPLWARYGNNSLELLDQDTIRQHTNTNIYIGGLLDKRSGHIHPLNLALGEAAALESRGGVIHELSRVTRIETGPHPKAYTDSGVVEADYLVVCGNAYLAHAVPELYHRIMPASTQIIATERLDEDLVQRLMPSGACVEDRNYFLDYYRMSADGRLLFGGGSVYGGKTPDDIEAELRPHLARTFPELKDARIDYAWSGIFALTFTRMPDVGRLGGGNTFYTHGYSGHGVTTTHLVGRLIAEAIQGRTERFDAFASLRHVPFPGGRTFRVPLSVLGSWYYLMKEKLGI